MGVFDTKKLSTQEHLDIEDIRDDLVVLKNGKVSLIIETTSLNFELLDTQEKRGRIGSFAAFLNSIRFPVQIVIKTQRTDIAKYLKLLENYKNKISSQAIVNQVSLYQEFINNLTQSTQILDKRFYVVIPSIRIPIVTTSWLRQMLGQKKQIININSLLEKGKEELYPKRDHVLKQFGNLGISAKQLKNDELIKLYYSVYEPDVRGLEILNIRDEGDSQGIVRSEGL